MWSPNGTSSPTALTTASLSDLHLRRELHRLAGNPWQSWSTEGVLVVNSTGLRQNYFVPGTWKGPGKRVEAHYLAAEREPTARAVTNLFGPIQLEPFSWQIIPWSNLTPAVAAANIATNADTIETDFYKLSFDPASGKVTRLLDKKLSRQVLATDSLWGFFQLVRERPTSNDRKAFHVRSVEGERYGKTGWRPDWAATRTSYTGAIRCRIERHTRAATLVLTGQAEGLTNLEQRITLYADSPMIDLSARFLKEDIRSPEAIYFVFPLNLNEGWRAHFDTAGIPTELDAEQIPGTSRDWVTVDTFASMHKSDFGVTLYCPDAPMVQMADFSWAKKHEAIPRPRNPLLLAWPLNNYWETNFRASQSGQVDVRYSFCSHGPFNATRAVVDGQQTCNPPMTHLVLDHASVRAGRLLEVEGVNVVLTHVKPAEDGHGMIVRLINLGSQHANTKITLPGQSLARAWTCGTLEDNRTKLVLSNGSAVCRLPPRHLTTIRLLGK